MQRKEINNLKYLKSTLKEDQYKQFCYELEMLVPLRFKNALIDILNIYEKELDNKRKK